MKLMKRIAVGIASLLVLTSCSVLQKAASASSLGGNTGTAIAAIYNVLKAAGGIDLAPVRSRMPRRPSPTSSPRPSSTDPTTW